MKRAALLTLLLFGALLGSAQWVLDGSWGTGGRKMEASDRWEVPVSIHASSGDVIVLSAAFDANGDVIPRWRGLSSSGSLLWEGEGHDGERPVGLTHATWQNRWFMLSEAPDLDGDTLANLMRVRAFDGASPIESWGTDGVVDLSFVGPLQEGGGIHGRHVELGGPEQLEDWLLVSGAAFDSCCAHQELPALSILSAWDGAYHPDFGQQGRIVLDPDGWQVEDSVRHEFSGRFSTAVFVPWNPMVEDPNDLENIRILAGGTYALAGAFQPFLAMFRWDGSLETEFGEAGIMTWFEDASLNHGVCDLRHRWEWLGPNLEVQVLIASPEGEPTLAAGTMSFGAVQLWPGTSQTGVTGDLDPGLPTLDPVRSVALASGYGWKLEDESVVVGTLEESLGWDGHAHPVWWTGPSSGFGFQPPYWTEDTGFESQRVGAATSRGPRLYVASTIPAETPAESTWLVSCWRENTSGVDDPVFSESDVPHPNPTRGAIRWKVDAGPIRCCDATGRLLYEWGHDGGVFEAQLPPTAAWLVWGKSRWERVRRLD